MYEIQKNVPVPEKRNKYPFRSMAKGDSFLVPYTDSTDTTEAGKHALKQRIASAAGQYRRRYCPSGQFVVRHDAESGGIRCWRTV